MDIFCKIINKKIPTKFLYEDDFVVAFEDINPVRSGHFLIVPKIHSNNLNDIDEKDFAYLLSISRKLALETIERLNVGGFQLKINNGKNAGQDVFHTHVHIIPSEK